MVRQRESIGTRRTRVATAFTIGWVILFALSGCEDLLPGDSIQASMLVRNNCGYDVFGHFDYVPTEQVGVRFDAENLRKYSTWLPSDGVRTLDSIQKAGAFEIVLLAGDGDHLVKWVPFDPEHDPGDLVLEGDLCRDPGFVE